ncbi:MAG: NAD(P)/FAD-dependent oxidoreductase [Firmicutes bacterium]|jgi:3-phenylpropionate/trans-cinnamate dioxygenase ferredoxin reductase subunit|nr:NAD(P)/FAD-dependent oxidoreductase [Bacillota bacterium]
MKERLVIIGASITGLYTALELVKKGYDGQIILIEKNSSYPYNPYPLSKEWLIDSEKTTPPLIKKRSYYESNNIDLRLNTSVESIDPIAKTVTTDQAEVIPYDKLLVATGSKLRQLRFKGDDAKGIFYLRNFDDAKKIKAWVQDAQDIAIIGAGFIGLELTSTFNQLGKNVSVLIRSGRPLDNILGQEASDYFVKMHEERQTNFLYEEEAEEFIKDDQGNLKAILTKSGKTLKADMAIIAVGVMPNIPFELDLAKEDGCIVINEFGETSLLNIYAGGDVAKWPYKGQLIHVEHWETAWSQAISLAKNIIEEKSSPYNVLPYFWTDQYDQTFEYLGNTRTWEKTYLRGSLEEGKFAIAYLDEENHPLAILFANKFEKRRDVERLLNKAEPLNEEKFTDANTPLKEI